MEMTPTTRALIARAADQIVREVARTPVGRIPIGTVPPHPMVSVSVQLGNAGGVRYVAAGLGLKGVGYVPFLAPGLVEAVATRDRPEAVRIVEGIIEAAVAQATGEWKRAG